MPRFVCISDTHCTFPELPDGDVLIHAGDACIIGDGREMGQFVKWFAKQPHKEKIYVPGNHDRWAWDHRDETIHTCRDFGITMLVDSRVYLSENVKSIGISVFGVPWTQAFGWTRAYMYDACDEQKHLGPLGYSGGNIDVLVTHGPPAGIFDCVRGIPKGSPVLLRHVQMLKPKYHVFGHIHDGHDGVREETWADGRTTVFANVARTVVLNGYVKLDTPVFTFDLPIDTMGGL